MHVVDINIYKMTHVQVHNTQCTHAVFAKFVRRFLVSWRVHELLTKVDCLSKDFPHTKGAQVIVKSFTTRQVYSSRNAHINARK